MVPATMPRDRRALAEITNASTALQDAHLSRPAPAEEPVLSVQKRAENLVRAQMPEDTTSDENAALTVGEDKVMGTGRRPHESSSTGRHRSLSAATQTPAGEAAVADGAMELERPGHGLSFQDARSSSSSAIAYVSGSVGVSLAVSQGGRVTVRQGHWVRSATVGGSSSRRAQGVPSHRVRGTSHAAQPPLSQPQPQAQVAPAAGAALLPPPQLRHGQQGHASAVDLASLRSAERAARQRAPRLARSATTGRRRAESDGASSRIAQTSVVPVAADERSSRRSAPGCPRPTRSTTQRTVCSTTQRACSGPRAGDASTLSSASAGALSSASTGVLETDLATNRLRDRRRTNAEQLKASASVPCNLEANTRISCCVTRHGSTAFNSEVNASEVRADSDDVADIESSRGSTAPTELNTQEVSAITTKMAHLSMDVEALAKRCYGEANTAIQLALDESLHDSITEAESDGASSRIAQTSVALVVADERSSRKSAPGCPRPIRSTSQRAGSSTTQRACSRPRAGDTSTLSSASTGALSSASTGALETDLATNRLRDRRRGNAEQLKVTRHGSTAFNSEVSASEVRTDSDDVADNESSRGSTAHIEVNTQEVSAITNKIAHLSIDVEALAKRCYDEDNIALQLALDESITEAEVSTAASSSQPSQPSQPSQRLTLHGGSAASSATPSSASEGRTPGPRHPEEQCRMMPPPQPLLSTIANLFEGRRHVQQRPVPYPDEDIDFVLADLVDSFLQTCHTESQRHLPGAEQVHAQITGETRESILQWLVQACDIMRFPDCVLYTTVLTLDRYCAVASGPLPMEHMQRVLMAVICTVLKTCAVQDEVWVNMPLRDLLLHLCRHTLHFEEILTMEHQVLRTLAFEVSAPSPLDFLDALSAFLRQPDESAEHSRPRVLANFLLQLSLFHAPLHYHQPHVILAAAAIYVALCSLHYPARMHRALLDDTAVACPKDAIDIANCVGACALELQSLWLQFAATRGRSSQCLFEKFNGHRLEVSLLLTPPPAGTLPHPANYTQRMQAWEAPPGPPAVGAHEVMTATVPSPIAAVAAAPGLVPASVPTNTGGAPFVGSEGGSQRLRYHHLI